MIGMQGAQPPTGRAEEVSFGGLNLSLQLTEVPFLKGVAAAPVPSAAR